MTEKPLSLLDTLLAEQHDLTAVERFARQHAAHARPAAHERYRALIPLEAPRPGQQYAFEVDLDACTGCKACVTGCHNLNGLDTGEVWRTVGLLHGGTPDAPAQQTVTTACHHCLEPACMTGCPVKAYDKDPITGIVKHLDDQCIGCQYCVFMCPYDAPKLNHARGIVRKCDLCSDRLAHAEAPACAQACPNEAIRVTIVDVAQAIEAAQASAFVPGAPAPGDTLPTTNYRTRRVLPRNLLPADFYAVAPEHSHPALVVMLVLTQLSVGAFAIAYALSAFSVLGPERAAPLGAFNALFALALGLAALGASVFHLGRPRYAFRALLGLRTSWLSREIAGFSLFAALAAGYALTCLVAPDATLVAALLEPLVAASGLAAVACSVMVYAATRRPSWSAPRAGFKFLSSTVVLGCATVLLTSAASARAPHPATRLLGEILAAATALKLLSEAALLGHLRSRRHTAFKRSAMLMVGDLAGAARWRFACGAIGGVALPLAAAFARTSGAAQLGLAASVFALSLAGELLERYLFFAATTAPRMPGGLA